MKPVLRHLELERCGDCCCVRVHCRRYDEKEIYDLTEELLTVALVDGCRRLIINLGGAHPPQLMYSIFLARLLTLQRQLREQDRELVLCDAGPAVLAIFDACRLQVHFRFAPDRDAAVALPYQ
jgi:hypothetical protein